MIKKSLADKSNIVPAIFILFASLVPLAAQAPPQPYALPTTVVAQKWFGTSAPGVLPGGVNGTIGNLPGDLYTNTATGDYYTCTAPQGTGAPACTSVTSGGWKLTGGGSGTVTSLVAGCGLSGGTITTSGTIAETILTAAHNGSYAVLTGDCGKSLTTNTAAAWTIAQAGTTGFLNGWFVIVNNVGAGSLTLTATTSTFYGGPSANISGSVLTIPALTSATVISNGTNYQVLAGGGSSSGSGAENGGYVLSGTGTNTITATAATVPTTWGDGSATNYLSGTITLATPISGAATLTITGLAGTKNLYIAGSATSSTCTAPSGVPLPFQYDGTNVQIQGVGIPLSAGALGSNACGLPIDNTGTSGAKVPLLNGNNTYSGSATYTGAVDASGATHTQPALKGAAGSIPGTCTLGEEYFATDATAGQNMYYCTATNTWTQQLNSGSAGANQALSNLSSVSINTSLLAQTGVDAGSTTKPFRNLFLWGTGTFGSTYLELTGAPTGNRVVTFPDASDTVVELTQTQTLTNKTVDGVTPTVFGYVDPTSSIQTQLNAKQATLTGTGLARNTGASSEISGDGTTSGSNALTLATVNANTGSCGDSTHVCQVTLDGKGRATAASAVSITGGSGTVTSVATTCGLSGGTITTTGTIGKEIVTTAHNGTYTVGTGDCGSIISSNVTASWTLPQAGSAGFGAGWFVSVQNLGTGAITLTTTTSTFYGGGTSGSSLTIPAGGVGSYVSDGTNWLVPAGTFSAHTVSAPANCIAAGASGTAYTCTTSPTFVPAAGDAIYFKADVANTGTASLVVNSQAGTPNIHKTGGSANIVANDMLAGQFTVMIFDGTNWDMQGQLGNAPAGSGTVNTGTATHLSYYATSTTAVSDAGADFVYNGTHTWTLGASGIFDLSAASVTAGLKIPAGAGAAPTADDFLAFDTTTHHLVSGSNGATLTYSSLAGTETLTNKTVDGVTPTVFGYVDPTSSIQTQLNAKGTGNAASNVTTTFSATPTFTCGSSSAGTTTLFSLSTALTANITSSTLATCTAGQNIAFHFVQDGTGGRTVVMPTNFDALTLDPTASTATDAIYAYDGTNGRLISYSGKSTPFILQVAPERAAPTGSVACPSGKGAFWFDSTAHAFVSCDNGGSAIVAAAAGTGTTASTTCTNQFVTVVSATAAPTCTTDTLASAQHANQGTTTTVLHGNGAGNPAFGAVVSADLNITTTTCSSQFVSAISATGTGTCTGLTAAEIPAVNFATPGSSHTFTNAADIFVCTTTCTITVPVPAAGDQFCVMNDDNVSTVITMSAIGSSARYENTARTAYGTAGSGTFVSGGAVGDAVCIIGRDSTHYLTASYSGAWTAN